MQAICPPTCNLAHNGDERPGGDRRGEEADLPGQNSLPHPKEKQFEVHWIVGRGGTYYDPSYGITGIGSKDYTDKAIALFEHPGQGKWRTPRYSDEDQEFVRLKRW